MRFLPVAHEGRGHHQSTLKGMPLLAGLRAYEWGTDSICLPGPDAALVFQPITRIHSAKHTGLLCAFLNKMRQPLSSL